MAKCQRSFFDAGDEEEYPEDQRHPANIRAAPGWCRMEENIVRNMNGSARATGLMQKHVATDGSGRRPGSFS